MLTARDSHGQRLPASVLETWLDLRALAWGQTQTEPLDFDDLKDQEWLGKGRSTICRHLATLREWFGQRWEVRQEKLIVYFDDAGEGDTPADRVPESGLVPKVGPAPEQEVSENKGSPESGSWDSPSLKDSLLKDSSVVNNRGRRVPKSGLVPKVGPAPISRPAAVEVFHAAANLYPDKAAWPVIEKAIGSEPEALEKWRATILGWILAGNKKINVTGMLDWYRQGRTGTTRPRYPRTNGESNGNLRPSANPNNSPDAAQIERDRKLRARRDAKGS